MAVSRESEAKNKKNKKQISQSTGCLKTLGHFLMSHISKTTMHEGNVETYLERKTSENYFDTKFTVIAFCNGKVTLKRNHIYKTALSYKVVKYT